MRRYKHTGVFWKSLTSFIVTLNNSRLHDKLNTDKSGNYLLGFSTS